jgi:pyruvate formate lyase activating enzyme
MIFKGWEKVSLIEWPGKICSVVFVGDCNFNCPWCYNRELVKNPKKLPDIDEKEVLAYLSKNKKMLDGVMITGGEPLQSQKANSKNQNKKIKIKHNLINFIKEVKKMGLGVGIETNGLNSEALEDLFKQKLIDYIAMDVKAPLKNQKPNVKNRYDELTGTKVNLEKIRKSINLIKNSELDYEFRTTVVPDLLDENDILEIAEYLKGAKRYYLQQFRPDKNWPHQAYPKKFFDDLREKIKNYFEICEIRV